MTSIASTNVSSRSQVYHSLIKKYKNLPRTEDENVSDPEILPEILSTVKKSLNMTSLVSTTLEKVIRRQNQILETLNSLKSIQPTQTRRGLSKGALESPIEAKIIQKRADQKWVKFIQELKVDGISQVKMDKIRSILLTGPENATFIPIKVAKVIWDDEYLSQRLIGPKKREPRRNERNLFVPDDEVKKLKDVLKCITSYYLRDAEWRVIVRDPINQATRYNLKTGIDEKSLEDSINMQDDDSIVESTNLHARKDTIDKEHDIEERSSQENDLDVRSTQESSNRERTGRKKRSQSSKNDAQNDKRSTQTSSRAQNITGMKRKAATHEARKEGSKKRTKS